MVRDGEVDRISLCGCIEDLDHGALSPLGITTPRYSEAMCF
jgi:hypothetical protein